MDTFDKTILGISFLCTSGAIILLYIQIVLFGKRIKKLEEQINNKNE